MPPIVQTNALSISQDLVPCAIVRVRDASPSILCALGNQLSCAWPVDSNTATGDILSILWIAPGEWAVMGKPQGLHASVERVCQDLLWQVSNLSAAMTSFEIVGLAAREAMSASCALDWHPTVFHAGRCAQTLFAQVQALIHQIDESPRYRIFVDSSLAHHVRDWLIDAASSIPSIGQPPVNIA